MYILIHLVVLASQMFTFLQLTQEGICVFNIKYSKIEESKKAGQAFVIRRRIPGLLQLTLPSFVEMLF